jgi:hypothetical protein
MIQHQGWHRPGAHCGTKIRFQRIAERCQSLMIGDFAISMHYDTALVKALVTADLPRAVVSLAICT